jgi:hypothetical protein
MPALEATDVYLTITWLGVVTHRREIEIETEPRKRLQLDWDGVVGAAHRGRTRASDSRVLQQHPRGTDIINVQSPMAWGDDGGVGMPRFFPYPAVFTASGTARHDFGGGYAKPSLPSGRHDH